jgi:hypothetical protein
VSAFPVGRAAESILPLERSGSAHHVNEELKSLEDFLDASIAVVGSGGRGRDRIPFA